MSTKIQDTVEPDDEHRLEMYEGHVSFTAQDSDVTADAAMDRDEFLAAVAKECDVVILDRADLPVVTVCDNGIARAGEGDSRASSMASDDPAWHRGRALAHLAVAEYLDVHPPTPPVDEADVEAVIRAATSAVDYVSAATIERMARALLASGKVEVKR
jgi:hypothetical protein